MTTAIDINTLDSLFDNQKKLDDIFNSIFDDDLDSELLTLRGVAFQISNPSVRLSMFYSEDKRDAVMNEDGSFLYFYDPCKDTIVPIFLLL